MVSLALAALNINVVGNGSAEYMAMDTEYRGFVRFKDFHKYVKSLKLGRNYEDADSSFSDEEVMDSVIKGYWKVIDPDHKCWATRDAIKVWINEMELGAEDDPDVMNYLVDEIDTNKDG